MRSIAADASANSRRPWTSTATADVAEHARSASAPSTCFHAPALSRAASHAAVSPIVSRERTYREARLARARQSIVMKPALSGVGRRQPQRQADPRRDAVREQRVVVDPCRARRRGRRRHAARRRGRAFASANAGLHALNVPADVARGELEHPGREIARIDELDRPLAAAPERRRAPAGRPGAADAGSARPSSRSGRCRRTGRRSVRGARASRASPKSAVDDRFAGRLQPAVVLEHLLGVRDRRAWRAACARPCPGRSVFAYTDIDDTKT